MSLCVMEIFDVRLLQERDSAIEVDYGNGCCWLPKSQIEFDCESCVGDLIEVGVPQWLAEEKEMC